VDISASGGGRTAIGHDVADLDFGVGGADVVFLLCRCARAGRREDREGGRKAPSRNWIAGILISLVCNVSIFLIGSAFRPLDVLNTFSEIPAKKAPCDGVAGGVI
jgi:hypothetical protein